MPIMTYESFLNRLAEKTYDNTKQLRRGVQQRRNGMEDLYGVMFSADGDAENPATFYISLSPDYVYLQRFAFKFVIKPFATTIKGGTSSATVDVNPTSLGVSGSNITPNPHDHSTVPHTHNIISGKAFVPTTSKYWRVKIADVDMTPYFQEQHGGAWISGEGIYPNNRLEDVEDFYDVLDACSLMIADGRQADVEKVLRSEFKKVEIVSDSPFSVDAYLYQKYSNLNR